MEAPQPRDEHTVIDALGVLEPLSVSLEAYSAAVAEGRLVKKIWTMSEEDLKAQNPDHPHATDGVKMHAADTIRDFARQDPLSSFTPAVLARVHGVLCDCCGAVRLSLATALFHAGDQSSVEPLRRLIAKEKRADLLDTSKSVHRTARAALGRCETRGEYFFPQDVQRVLVISDEIPLICDLLDVTDKFDAHLYQSHSAIDLIAIGGLVAQIVDRRICVPKDWAAYLDYLKEINGEDETRLIVIDNAGPAPSPVLKETEISKPPESVDYTSRFLPAAICSTVADLLVKRKGRS